jgi:cytoskeletal protein RodZ
MPLIISIVVFVIAGSSLLLWSTHKASEISEVDVETESVQVADTEADQTQEDSGEELESTPKSYSEVEIGNPKDDIVLLQPPPVAIPQKNREPAVAVPRPRERTPAPREETSPPPEKPLYITGVLRRFSSSDFKKEVVEASKTYPVLFQFYSQT